MRARPMSRSGQPTCYYCCTLLGQGDTTKLTATKLYVLARLILKAEQMYIWCARLGSSQPVKISDFPPQSLGLQEWREGRSAVDTGALHLPGTLLVNKTLIKQTICQMNHWRESEWQERWKTFSKAPLLCTRTVTLKGFHHKKDPKAVSAETAVVFMQHFKSCIGLHRYFK